MKVLGIFTGRSGSTSEWMTKAALSGAAEQGVEIEGSVYTTEQLLAALLKLKKEVGRNA